MWRRIYICPQPRGRSKREMAQVEFDALFASIVSKCMLSTSQSFSVLLLHDCFLLPSVGRTNTVRIFDGFVHSHPISNGGICSSLSYILNPFWGAHSSLLLSLLNPSNAPFLVVFCSYSPCHPFHPFTTLHRQIRKDFR